MIPAKDRAAAYRARQAAKLKRYEAALTLIANARTAMDGGSIAENRRIASKALMENPNDLHL